MDCGPRLRPICRLRTWGRWAKIGVPAALGSVFGRMRPGALRHGSARKKDRDNDATSWRTQSPLPIDANAGAVVGGPAGVPGAGDAARGTSRSMVQDLYGRDAGFVAADISDTESVDDAAVGVGFGRD